jgi:hypothetical protein
VPSAAPANSVESVSVSDEIRASAAAHRDLGPGYENAVAEGLVERIGDEIDRRIDAKLYGHMRSGPGFQQQAAPYPQPAPQPPAKPKNPPAVGFWAAVLGLGSMGLAVGGTAAVLHPGWSGTDNGLAPLVALIWLVVGAINIAYARRR